MNHTSDLLTIEDRRTVGLDGSPGGTIQINSPEGPIALLGKDKKAMAVKIVHRYNTHAALVEALRETQQLLQVWNYDFVKEQFYKNAETLKQVSNG